MTTLENMMETVLILGATGNIGGLASERLTAHGGVRLRLASSREAGLATLAERFPDAEIVQADWNDELSLEKAMRGVSRVLVVTPDFVTDEQIVTPNIIRAAKAAGSIDQIVRLIAIPPGLTAEKLTQRFLDTRCGANLHVVAKPLFDASGLPMTYVNVPGWIMFNLPWFLAPEVKARRQLAMPAVTDAERMWISEGDIADVIAAILTVPAADHVGVEHILTASARYDYSAIARILGDELGSEVRFVDDDGPLRDAMGEAFDTLMTYFEHETQAYGGVEHSETIAQLLGRPQESVQDYIKANRELFV
ncbi:MAG: NmrA family NAD(P)-binding protein [Pseudomonadota bacterium]